MTDLAISLRLGGEPQTVIWNMKLANFRAFSRALLISRVSRSLFRFPILRPRLNGGYRKNSLKDFVISASFRIIYGNDSTITTTTR